MKPHVSVAGLVVVLSLVPVVVSAQIRSRLEARGEITGFGGDGGRGTYRPGIGVTLERAGPGAAGRLAVSIVPASDQERGWQTYTVEAAPILYENSDHRFMLRFIGGAHHARHREKTGPLILNLPPTGTHAPQLRVAQAPSDARSGSSVDAGWAGTMGAGFEVGTRAGRLGLSLSMARLYLLSGPNREAHLDTIGVGLSVIFP